MPPADQSRKLRHIASLRSLEEVEGWHMGIAVRRALGGDWFPGEEDALRFRAAEIQKRDFKPTRRLARRR